MLKIGGLFDEARFWASKVVQNTFDFFCRSLRRFVYIILYKSKQISGEVTEEIFQTTQILGCLLILSGRNGPSHYLSSILVEIAVIPFAHNKMHEILVVGVTQFLVPQLRMHKGR